MESDTLLSEARARIIWGESASSVRFFLTANGISVADADARITEFVAERNATIRRIGLKNALMGAAFLVGAGLLLYLGLRHFHSSTYHYYGTDRGIVALIAGAVLGGLYGIWKLVNGLIDLLRPQAESESVTELSG